jgi:NADPH:quinone reductase-like Zn-dependent oxidoreductase
MPLALSALRKIPDAEAASSASLERSRLTPRQVRAVVVDPTAPRRLTIKPVELHDPDRVEVAVRVTAISLTCGETRRAVQQAEAGWRPGWDFAGVVEIAAVDGSGPDAAGTRVVGILPSGLSM